MIQGILCFRIDCCGHEIAGSDDGFVNLGHTHLDPRAYKRTKRGTCIVSPSCSLLSLQYLAKINDDDVRRVLLCCCFLSRIFHSLIAFVNSPQRFVEKTELPSPPPRTLRICNIVPKGYCSQAYFGTDFQ